jgi:hypothetical protein
MNAEGIYLKGKKKALLCGRHEEMAIVTGFQYIG